MAKKLRPHPSLSKHLTLLTVVAKVVVSFQQLFWEISLQIQRSYSTGNVMEWLFPHRSQKSINMQSWDTTCSLLVAEAPEVHRCVTTVLYSLGSVLSVRRKQMKWDELSWSCWSHWAVYIYKDASQPHFLSWGEGSQGCRDRQRWAMFLFNIIWPNVGVLIYHLITAT